ncbi:MAG TPA: hypothetical protein VF311_10135 [Terriglobales bacterium]
MAYQPSAQILEAAISHLRANAGKKVMPIVLSTAAGISPISAKRVCKYLNDQGSIIRFGRGYAWNLKGAAATGPIPAIFKERVLKLKGLVLEGIRQQKLHNQLIGRAYFNGRLSSPLTGRKQTLTLDEGLRDLKHMRTHLDWQLLLEVEHRISLTCPTGLAKPTGGPGKRPRKWKPMAGRQRSTPSAGRTARRPTPRSWLASPSGGLHS